MKLSAPNLTENRPIDYRNGGDLRWVHENTLPVSIPHSLQCAFICLVIWKLQILEFVYSGDWEWQRKRESRGEVNIKLKPSCLMFSSLCSALWYVTGTGYRAGRWHDCRLLISANTARNLLRGKCQMCQRRACEQWRQILKPEEHFVSKWRRKKHSWCFHYISSSQYFGLWPLKGSDHPDDHK